MKKSDNLNVREETAGNQRVGASGASCDGTPMTSKSSPLVSRTATINMPRGLVNIDVAATFRVPLTNVGDLDVLTRDIEAGDLTNLIVEKSTMPSDPIVQSVDINIKSTSYVGANVASAKDQPKAKSNFRSLVADFVFDGVNISISRKVNSEANLVDVVTIGIPSFPGDDFTKETIRVKYEWRPPRCDICKIFGHVHDHFPQKVVSPPIVATSNVVTPTVEITNNSFQTVGKKKKRKSKSKSTNGGQFAGPSVN
nr:zinc knuckle CX2CX4HX4C [Tanacetum cinerariifolium]